MVIPVIFDTVEKLFVLVKIGPEGKIVFVAKNKYVNSHKYVKKNYNFFFHIWVNAQLYLLVTLSGESK